MSTRHLVMLSLGGAIGTGLFLWVLARSSLKQVLSAQLVAYFLGGLIAYMVMLCLGELAVHMPVAGSRRIRSKIYWPRNGLYDFLAVLADMDRNAWYRIYCRSLTHARMVPHISMWIWTIIFAITILGLNLSSTRIFVEQQFGLVSKSLPLLSLSF